MKSIVVVDPEDDGIEAVIGPISDHMASCERYEFQRALNDWKHPKKLYIVQSYSSFSSYAKDFIEHEGKVPKT